jgi:hypothetical protein
VRWEVLFTDEVNEWLRSLSQDQQDAVVARVRLLQEQGPSLGRPVVDTVKGSTYQNMKELRASKGGALRILFVFDPLRRAILLVGGDKSGQWEAWYRQAIPAADALYTAYLAQLRKEGLIP